MSLRDRIICAIRTPRLVQRESVPLADAHLCTDAILSDPEIAALREVAEKAKAASDHLRGEGWTRQRCYTDLYAALARLEEARK